TFSGTVNVSGNNILTLSNPAVTTFSGSLSGSGSLTLIGGGVIGTLALTGDNSAYGGVLTLQSGTLAIGANNALGGTVSLSGGTVWRSGGTLLSPAAGLTFSNPVQLSGTPTLGGAGANALTVSGPVTLAAATALAVTNSATIAGVISGGATGSLTIAGPGTLNLQAANTYTGTTTVSGGTLALNGAGALAATAGIVLNQGGTLFLDNTAAN